MDNNLSRRKFLGAVMAIPAIGALGTPLLAAGQFVYPPDSLLQPQGPKKVGNFKSLKVWEAIKFDFNDIPALVVKTTDTEARAYYLKCTHLGCTVGVPSGNLEGKQLVCPCHGGHFDALGNNVSGPPPIPLNALAVKLEPNGDIIIQNNPA